MGVQFLPENSGDLSREFSQTNLGNFEKLEHFKKLESFKKLRLTLK
jgi:hypothetical protein